MSTDSEARFTRLLEKARSGDEGAREEVVAFLYDTLHTTAKIYMAKEREGHTWSPTDLLHEALLSLGSQIFKDAPNRAYIISAASIAMQRLLCDYARKQKTDKRGGQWTRSPFDEAIESIEREGLDMESLREALDELKKLSPHQYEIIVQGYFGGFNQEQIADHLSIAQSTVSKQRDRAILWLKAQLQK